MLLEAFGLQRDPFLDTADPAFFYETMATASNRRRLYECLARGRGLAVVLGPVGAGKTSLFNAVTARLIDDPQFVVGLILDPTFDSEAQFLETIIAALGFPAAPALAGAAAQPRHLREHLKRCLFETTATDGRQAIVLIDEAQLLPDPLLETLRTLLNFQLDERKLLSIGLAGQAEIVQAILRRPNLSDRVALWLDLHPLTEPEAGGLVDHRLRCAGYVRERSPFGQDELHDLWRRSQGLPRRLGALARESMELAAERGARDVSRLDIEDAARRLPPILDTGNGSLELARPWWRFWKVAQ
jgi:type II secretory pathway predicted ATPase ExeA